MPTKRVIARLDIKGPNLVKGINLEGLRVLGNPSEFAKYYYESGADEILLIDSVASLYERNSLDEIISYTSRNTFVPITVGGGIRNIDDIRRILRAGADKVSINTAAIKTPDFIREAVEKFGSSTIVITMEVIKDQNGEYLCFTDNGREYTGLNILNWIEDVQKIGVGEIILTSVDNEGTGDGPNFELLKTIENKLRIPLIYHGGIGNINHVVDVFKNFEIDGISLASSLHYGFIQDHNTNPSIDEGNISFIKNKRSFKKIEGFTISQLKEKLIENNIYVR